MAGFRAQLKMASLSFGTVSSSQSVPFRVMRNAARLGSSEEDLGWRGRGPDRAQMITAAYLSIYSSISIYLYLYLYLHLHLYIVTNLCLSLEASGHAHRHGKLSVYVAC